MALRKTTQTPYGLTVQGAYHRVSALSLSRPASVSFSVSAYVTGAANEQPLMSKTYQFTYNLEGANVLAQAYDYLKTLPEFENANDC